MPPPDTSQPTVFIGYAQTDRHWRQLLAARLELLGVRVPDDTDSPDLTHWQESVATGISVANVGVLLISPAALTSDSIAFIDSQLREHRAAGRVVAVFVERAELQAHQLLDRLPVIPSSGKPLAEFTVPDLDAELESVARQIADVAFAVIGREAPQPDATVPLETWRKLDASTLLEQLVERAAALAVLTERAPVLTSSALLLALMDVALSGTSDSPSVLTQSLPDDVAMELRKRMGPDVIGGPSPRAMSADAWRTLTDASRIAAYTNGESTIHVRHLIAALLHKQPPPPLLQRFDLPEIRRRLFAYIRERVPEDDLGRWEQIAYLGLPNEDGRILLAGYEC